VVIVSVFAVSVVVVASGVVLVVVDGWSEPCGELHAKPEV
jgi:hypothetical protein